MKSGHTPNRGRDEYWVDCSIPWFTLTDVWQLRDETRKYLEETSAAISELGLANSAAELLPVGTVVLSRTASVGFSGIMPRPMATSQDFWNWVCGPRVVPDYLLYVFRAMSDELRSLVRGSTHQTIYQPIAASMSMPLPPRVEQEVIVHHLDRETARINDLIAEQEALVTNLRQRRGGVIDHAIRTAGHETPATRLRYLYTPSEQANRPHELVLSVFREHGVVPKLSMPGNYNKTPLDLTRYLLVRPDDVVVNKMKAWQGSLGVSAHRGIVSPDYEVLRPVGNRLIPRFAHYLLRAPFMRAEYASRSKGIRPAQWRLYWDSLADIVVRIPELHMQERVAAELDAVTARLDELSEQCDVLVALLKERRSALITAAVTGKIDVRDPAV